jgi:hypothetical protein
MVVIAYFQRTNSVEILIEHYTAAEAKVICESVNNGKDVFLAGRFLSGNLRNRNGRVYPVNEIANAVRSINEMIKDHGSLVGELDHPASRLTTELKYASHLITEMHVDGDHGIGKMKILDTPYGLVVKELIKGGFRPDVSSRGAGNVNGEGIVEGFVIQTVDIVAQGSGFGTTPSTVYEHMENSKIGYKTLTLAEAVQQDQDAQKYFIKEAKKFLDELLKYK